jgi:hypothetical protein
LLHHLFFFLLPEKKRQTYLSDVPARQIELLYTLAVLVGQQLSDELWCEFLRHCVTIDLRSCVLPHAARAAQPFPAGCC